MKLTTCGWLATALVPMLSLPSLVVAQPNARTERGGILLGAFITDRDSSTRLDSENGDGTEIELEEDLGLESSNSVARLGGHIWIGKRHRLDAAFFDLSREATTPVKETIEFGDEVFVIDTVVTTDSDLTITKVDYTFAAIARERGYLGITAGLYVAKTAISIGEVTVGRYESEDLTAPLPLLGLRGDYALGEKFTLRGAAQWFGYEADKVDGRLTDLYVGVDYAFTQRFALGLAYNRVTMSLGAEEERGFEGRLNWGYDGMLLYAKYDFGNRD